MADHGQRYIPEISKIFAGEEQILSWFELAECLYTKGTLNPVLLLDRDWTSRLTSEALSFAPQKQTTNAAFETKTAAISISPTTNEHYDINEIKKDALWLSGELNLDSVEALRIALLEWQNRPHSFLQAGYSEAEITSLNGVYGSNLAFDAELQATFFSLRSEDEFKTQTSRRCRQVFIYFKESVSLLKTILILSGNPAEVSRLTAGTVEAVILDKSIGACADLLNNKIAALVAGPQWTIIDDHTNYVWQVGHLHTIAMLMEYLIAASRTVSPVPSAILRNWILALASVGFFTELEASPLLPVNEVNRIHLLADLTSLAVIDPATSLTEVDASAGPRDSSWLRDAELIAEVHSVLYEALVQSCARAVPAAFVWALCLHKIREKAIESRDHRDSPVAQRGSDNVTTFDTATGRQGSLTTSVQTCFEDAIDAVQLTETHDTDSISTMLSITLHSANVAEILAEIACNANVDLISSTMTARSQFLQEVVAATLATIPDCYGPEILLPQFAILEPRPENPQMISPDPSDACTTFLNDSLLLSDVFDVAASRFPHEAVPFLRLCRLLAGARAFEEATQYISYRLRAMEFFTHAKTGPLGDYHTVREDENLNLVQLENNCYAFPSDTEYLKLTAQQNTDKTLIIPAGTIGEIISDTDVPVVRWQYRYSAFGVIGQWLELHFNGTLHDVVPPQDSPIDVVTEIILLLTQLLKTTSSFDKVDIAARKAAINSIIDEVSTNLSSSESVIDLIFNILEHELQSYRRRPTSLLDTSILHASIKFITVLLDINPDEFWSRVAKTSIARVAGSANLLYVFVNGIEGMSGLAQVTEAASDLYQSMIRCAVKRPSNLTHYSQSFSRSSVKLLNNEDKLFEDMLYNLTSTMVELYDILPSWKQLSEDQETRIISHLSESFLYIMYLSYGVGSNDSHLTECYRRAASLILNRLNPLSIGDAKSSALIQYLLPTTRTGDTFVTDRNLETRMTSCTRLAVMLLKVRALHVTQPIGLGVCLFELSPVLIRHIHVLFGKKLPVAQLLCILLQSVPDQTSVSLLGLLGSTTCVALLDCLVAYSLSSTTWIAAMSWNVLASLVNRHQQWLSMIILTGSVPDKQLQSSKNASSVYRGKLFVGSATARITQRELWDALASTEQCDLACSILRFLSTAQENWSWILPSNSATTAMFKTLIDMITKPNVSNSTVSGSRNQANALLVDLGSVVLQHAKSTRDVTMMKVFFPLVKWLTQNAIDVSSYNASLHLNLSKNFTNKFGYDISNFARTDLFIREAREFYDIQLADVMLDGKSGWKLEGRHASQSFFAELNRANVNMNTVFSDFALLQSFRNFCIEHAAFFVQDSSIRVTMAHIIQRCLAANTKNLPSEAFLETLFQSRIDIALALIKCLVEVKAQGSDFRNLLVLSWQCVMYRNASYDLAMANNDLVYWHSSICVTLLAMQFHVGRGWKPLATVPASPGALLKHTESVIPEVVEIASVIIGDGLVSVVTSILEQKQADMQQRSVQAPGTVGMKDITLILNVFETILRMFRLPDFTVQVSERLLSSGALGRCTQMYTLSHLLTNKTHAHEPVYAILAARLLVSLSTLQLVAEEMAVDGILSEILTARITQALQRSPEGVSHLDQRNSGPTLYALWSDGILPLALNLLHAVRAPIAAEIGVFLNSFHQQLRTLSNAFQAKLDQFITLALAKEVATVSLLSYILEDYRLAGASVGVDPMMIPPLTGFDEHKRSLLENLREIIRLDKGILKTKIVPTNDKELLWHRGDELVDKIMIEIKSAICCLDRDETMEAESEQPRS